MAELRVVTLGTSSGKPTLSRGLSAIAVVHDGVLSLFDCGEGTQLQFIRAGLRPSRLALSCVSHFHGDHINGLPGFLSTMSLNQHDRPVTMAGPKGIRDYLHVLRKLRILVPAFNMQVKELNEAGEIFRNEAFAVRTARLDHRITCWGFRFDEHDRPGRFDLDAAARLGVPPGPLFGELQRGEAVTTPTGETVTPDQVLGQTRRGRSVAIVTDSRPCEAGVELARGADLLIHEGTYGPDLEKHARKRGHSTVVEAAEVAVAAGVERLVITHISPRYDNIRPLLKAARKVFPNTMIARDLMSFEIPLEK